MEEENKKKDTFEAYPPTEEQIIIMNDLRQACRVVAGVLSTLPVSRETSLAITKLEEVAMWGNKSVIING